MPAAWSTNVNYTYDALNRLSTVSEVNTGTSSYNYDNVGNLQSVTYPNGVAHNYAYDTRNRLTNLGVNASATAIASYAYTLEAAGHRLSVSELSGRTVNYGYDNLYRLTSETIASDPHALNGAVNYIYDAVGNRKQITSTLAPVPAGLWNYDANDRFTAGDTYDANGNTISSGGIANVYDFENHLIQKAGVTIVYDGDGNRVSKTVAGVTTTYLVDTLNPTGYAQVLAESFAGASGAQELSHNYVYGLELISQARHYFTGTQSLTQTIYYVYDGHGSVRALTGPTGTVTDTYDYDAFGNLIHSSTTLSSPTLNNYLFAGEQFDSDLNLYYNRARYLNVSTGRFWTMDIQGGDVQAPQSLHKYLYASADPVNRGDPSGNDDIAELSASFAVASTISSMSNVLVAAAYSAAYGSYPDAVAFGVFGAASFNAFDYVGGLVGYEIVFDPRLKEVATFVFGGIEPSVSVSNAPAYLDGKHGLLHKEAGGFVGWYWNLNDLKPGNFGLAGLSFGGGFLGQETTPEGANAMLFGFTNDPDLSVFGVYGGEVRLSDEQSVSEGAMISSIAVAEAAFTALGATRSGGAVSPTGAAVGSLLNAGLGSLWVHYTYGRPR